LAQTWSGTAIDVDAACRRVSSRHQSAASVDIYTRTDDIWKHNAATNLGL